MKHNATSWQKVTISDGTEMRLFVARPDHTSPAPCVIVLQEAFGVNAHIRDVAGRIAALGYVAVAPELYHRTAPPGFEVDYGDREKFMPHMQALTNLLLEDDLRATYDWLKADAQADAEKAAAVGYCLGGKAAFIANAILPLKAAVSYYGGGIASMLGSYTGWQHGPLTLFWGGKDKHIDVQQRNAVADALREAGKTFTQVEFSDAGHGFFCEERESYHADAARESWAMLAVFLKNHIH